MSAGSAMSDGRYVRPQVEYRGRLGARAASRIRHVLLDADGVLQDIPGGWYAAMEPYLGGRSREFLHETWADELPMLAGRGDYLPVLAATLDVTELTPHAAGDRVRAIVRGWAALPPAHPLRPEPPDRVPARHRSARPRMNDVYAANVFADRSTGTLRPRFFDTRSRAEIPLTWLAGIAALAG